jgi:hypothetical protein
MILIDAPTLTTVLGLLMMVGVALIAYCNWRRY